MLLFLSDGKGFMARLEIELYNRLQSIAPEMLFR